MDKDHYFVADAALIDRLGRELVGKQETALIELVKNSFDADAVSVDVTLSGYDGGDLSLVIDDNGSGMTLTELKEGFLRLASDEKVRNPVSPVFKRQRAGRKGIGRFATQRLGEWLRLKTWSSPTDEGIELFVDWTRFTRGQRLDQIRLSLFPTPARGSTGTLLTIEKLRDEWTEAQIKRCWRGLLNLQQPFPVAPVDLDPDSDPGFAVRFLRHGDPYNDPKLIADLQTEILDHHQALIEMRVDDSGAADWRLSGNVFGEDRPWTLIHHEYSGSGEPPPYAHLRDVGMKAHYFILDPTLFSGMLFSRLRDVLSDEGGIRLYRNGFRVVPYGDPDNDWLRLDEAYVKRANLFPAANRNYFGVVEVHDEEGLFFEEHTSREGLIETQAFTELKSLTQSVLITAALKIAEDRGRKIRAGRPSPPRPTSDFLVLLRKAAERAREAAGAASDEDGKPLALSSGQSAAKEVADLLEQTGTAYERAKAELADEATLLRMLATLGLTAAEFSHETGMTFEAMRIDVSTIFSAVEAGNTKDKTLIERVENARAMLDRLDALTSYLNEIASARSAREMAPVSVSKTIKEFAKGISRQAQSAGISIDIDVPDFDPLFTRPMHKAEVASILLNFYSNSLKAMRRTEAARKIRIGASRSENDEIVLVFSDTGDGIKDNVRGQVFDLFFTTRHAAAAGASTNEQVTGTGLGLWIVNQIAENAGGKVKVGDAVKGYSTSFELRLKPEVE